MPILFLTKRQSQNEKYLRQKQNNYVECPLGVAVKISKGEAR